jgi:hypothetical protein
MQKLLLVSVLMGTALAGTAVAGPKWCTKDMPYADGSAIGKDRLGDDLKAVAFALCNPDRASVPKSAVDEEYRKLSARLGLSDDDWADVVEWSMARMHDSRITAPDQKKPWSQYDPMEQFAGVERNFVTAGGKMGAVDAPYFVDALGARLTETGRLGFIEWCMSNGGDDKPVISAMCQGDIDAFDPKKVAGEIRASKGHDGWDRMQIRFALAEVGADIATHAAGVKKLVAKDPIYGQMFDIAKKARAEWKASADLVTLATAMEDAMITASRRASDGCADKTTKAVLSSVSKIPANYFVLHRKADQEVGVYLSDMRSVIASALLSEPDEFLAINAHAMCRDMTNTGDMLMGLVYSAGSRWPGFRGSRTAALTRIFQANLQPDDRDAQIHYPDVHRMWFGDHNGAGRGHGGYGTVTKVSTKGGKTHIEFQKKKHQEYVSLHCKKTGRIEAIRDNGEIVYEETCSDSKLVTSMVGQDPLDVSADQGKSVKPGMVIDVSSDYVLMGWPNAKTDKPSVILGQPVK